MIYNNSPLQGLCKGIVETVWNTWNHAGCKALGSRNVLQALGPKAKVWTIHEERDKRKNSGALPGSLYPRLTEGETMQSLYLWNVMFYWNWINTTTCSCITETRNRPIHIHGHINTYIAHIKQYMNVFFFLGLFSKIQNILEHMYAKECLVVKLCVQLFGTL